MKSRSLEPSQLKKRSRNEKAMTTLGIPEYSQSNSRFLETQHCTHDLSSTNTQFSEQSSEPLAEEVGSPNFSPKFCDPAGLAQSTKAPGSRKYQKSRKNCQIFPPPLRVGRKTKNEDDRFRIVFVAGEKGRKRAKKADFGRFPGRAARRPLNPHLLHPHLRQPNISVACRFSL